MLEKVRETTDHPEWLFPHQDRTQPRKYDALYQATHRFCKASGIEPFAPRDCRRTFKTLAGSIGISLEMRTGVTEYTETVVDHFIKRSCRGGVEDVHGTGTLSDVRAELGGRLAEITSAARGQDGADARGIEGTAPPIGDEPLVSSTKIITRG